MARLRAIFAAVSAAISRRFQVARGNYWRFRGDSLHGRFEITAESQQTRQCKGPPLRSRNFHAIHFLQISYKDSGMPGKKYPSVTTIFLDEKSEYKQCLINKTTFINVTAFASYSHFFATYSYRIPSCFEFYMLEIPIEYRIWLLFFKEEKLGATESV